MDIYYEQYVISGEKNRNKKKKIFLSVVMGLFILTSVVFFIFFYLSLMSGGTAEILIMGAMFALSVVSVFMLRRQKNRLDVDFDYILKDEKFVIVRVFNRKARKKYVEVDVKAIQAMGRLSGDNAGRYISMPQVKKLYANMSEDEDKVYYAFFTNGADRTVLFFQPDEQLLAFFKRIIGRDIVDKKTLNVKRET